MEIAEDNLCVMQVLDLSSHRRSSAGRQKWDLVEILRALESCVLPPIPRGPSLSVLRFSLYGVFCLFLAALTSPIISLSLFLSPLHEATSV
jgi:hypothetical protein